jgi:acyl-CoA hydrolase/GNAT superfamily N-acetyltransferase
VNTLESWTEKVKARTIELEMLKKIIKPGSRVYLGTACSEPVAFTKYISENHRSFSDCEFLQFLTVSKMGIMGDETPTRYRHNTLSVIGTERIRNAIRKGTADFTPIKSSEIPYLLKTYSLRIDVCLIQVSPPDSHGYCSLGINVDMNKQAVRVANCVIAQINPNMPVAEGDTFIHSDDIHSFYSEATPLVEYAYEYSEQDVKLLDQIAPHIARLIENGSTLNIGLGKIPNGIWKYMHNKQDLGIYAELIVLTHDLIECIEKKVITCRQNRYPTIMTTFILGTNELFPYLAHHPLIRLHPTDFINDIRNIGLNKKLCSIYGALSVDLTGQVSNHYEGKIYTGIGGEMDFVMGSHLVKRSKIIIVLPSTTKDGNKSRIVPTVTQVSLPKTEVDYVVTEWGIARLAGKSLRERALQLIGIAHPKFREELLLAAKDFKYVYADQILPRSQDGVVVIYPEKYESTFITKTGEEIFFRPVKPTDEAMIQRFYYKLDERSLIYRFFTPRQHFPHEETQMYVNIDYDYSMMLIGFNGRDDNAEIACIASYYRDPSGSSGMAEIETTVVEKWQGKGLGKRLFVLLGEIAQEKGIEGFYGEVLVENRNILNLLQSLPFRLIFHNYGDSMEFSYRFSDIREEGLTKPIVRDERYMNLKNPI